jgi:hypothetical protein
VSALNFKVPNMRTRKLTRAQRRRMRKLADPIDRIPQADLNYFAQFPHRRHRVRAASRAEIILLGGAMSVPPGRQLYTAVRNVRPGLRLRVVFHGPADADPELFSDEAKAREIYAFHETEEDRVIGAQMIELIEPLK